MSQPASENTRETDAPPGVGEPGNHAGREFQPGQSGNPGGRPKGFARRVREKVGDDGDLIASLWESAMSGYLVTVNPKNGEREYEKVSVSDRLAASKLLAERGWGKPPQFVPIEDGDPLGLDVERQNQIAASLDERLDELAAKRAERAQEATAAPVQAEAGEG